MASLPRLLALVALLLMPFGMAAPATAMHRGEAAAMPMQHCPDPAPSKDVKGGLAQCTMACSAALPAMDSAPGASPTISCAPLDYAFARPLSGVDPDIATPPPKRS